MSAENIIMYPPHPPQIPPSPPPPIRGPTVLLPTTATFSTTTTTARRKQIELEECKWASAYPEIQKACYLARVCFAISPKSCRLKNIRPILQEGPTCGLAALSMLANGNPSADELLYLARRSNYTRNGEMFSARNLYELVSSVLKNGNRDGGGGGGGGKVRLHEDKIYSDTIKQVLLNGGCLLVPYDPDFNHGPCLRNGHKAHWALIVGYLIDDNDKFFVFSRHGKTKNIAIWSLKALSASNSNLNEFEQPKGYPHAEFILPLGGIAGELGLKNRCIIIERLNCDEIVIK